METLNQLYKKIEINLYIVILAIILFVIVIILYQLYALFIPMVGLLILSIYIRHQLNVLKHKVL